MWFSRIGVLIERGEIIKCGSPEQECLFRIRWDFEIRYSRTGVFIEGVGIMKCGSPDQECL